jgi:Arc/MetJ family transcription regulator
MYTRRKGETMQTATKKTAKHFRLDAAMIKSAQKILGAKTEKEAIETALSEVVYQEKMRKFIEQTAGKYKFEGLNEAEGCARYFLPH